MKRYRFCTGVLPEKEDNYRNARKHTSEVRHMFVCHAEWMLRHADFPKGQVGLLILFYVYNSIKYHRCVSRTV